MQPIDIKRVHIIRGKARAGSKLRAYQTLYEWTRTGVINFETFLEMTAVLEATSDDMRPEKE